MFFKQKKIQKRVTGKWGIPRSAECSETRGHRFSVKKNRNCSEENYLTTQGPQCIYAVCSQYTDICFVIENVNRRGAKMKPHVLSGCKMIPPPPPPQAQIQKRLSWIASCRTKLN